MFAGLKNKIREEIGSDVSTVVRNAGSVRGINSRHVSQTGSSSSISGSQLSLDDSRDIHAVSPSPILHHRRENSCDFKLSDGTQLTPKDVKKLESREEEWRRRLMKKEAELQKKIDKKDEEWRIKLLDKEKEWKKTLEKQMKEKLKVEEEKQKAESARKTLEIALRDAEEYKKKLYSFQEDAEQLEGFQTQEMAKIKHLLLAKEQEVDEKSHQLKTALAEMDTLKAEVSRLRRYEEELNNVQESSKGEFEKLKSEFDQKTEKLSALETEIEQLKLNCDGEKANNSSLHMQLARLRENLENEREASAKLRLTLEKERNDKDFALIRNAQVSQDYEIAMQEKRLQENENAELQNKIDSLEELVKKMKQETEESAKGFEEAKERLIVLEQIESHWKKNEEMEKTLKSNLSDMEEQLSDKTKTIKVLQQRLADMKKTLQRELHVPSSSFDSDAEQSAAILSPSSSKTVTAKNSNGQEEDVNFKYLKHVLIKFLTSREYEALHLTRAVATLLHFSPEEERLLQETLEWKMSWFGTRPNLGFGQTAKAIPPS